MKDEKGQALPMAILALAIGSLLIVPFLSHAGSSLIGSRVYGEIIAQQSASDAGIEHAIWSLTRGSLAEQFTDPGDIVTYQLGETLNGVTATVTVTANQTAVPTGDIAPAKISTLEFDISDGFEPDIVQISSTVLAIAYRGTSNDGFLKTVSIAADGTISPTVISTLEFDTSNGATPHIIPISGNVYAIIYSGSTNNGFLKTVTIAPDGTISPTIIATLAFGSSLYTPHIIPVTGNVYVTAGRGNNNNGVLRTIEIAPDGSITNPNISSFIFDNSYGYEPVIIHVSGDVFAIAYRGINSDGFIVTVGINTSLTVSAFYEILSTAGDSTTRAFVNTANTTATIVSWLIE